MKNYFKVTNVHNREELGRLYASMNNLEYYESSRKNMKRNYKKLGNTICEMYKGFFKGDCFYGLMI